MKHLLPALLFVCTSVIVRAADTDWTQSSDLIGIVHSMTALKVVASATAVPATPALSGSKELSPQAEKFIRSIGLDPKSKEVMQAAADGTIVTLYRDDEKRFSLESLALEGAKNGVRMFVATRWFIHNLKADYENTPFLTADYDGLYLTMDERKLATRKMIEQ